MGMKKAKGMPEFIDKRKQGLFKGEVIKLPIMKEPPKHGYFNCQGKYIWPN